MYATSIPSMDLFIGTLAVYTFLGTMNIVEMSMESRSPLDIPTIIPFYKLCIIAAIILVFKESPGDFAAELHRFIFLPAVLLSPHLGQCLLPIGFLKIATPYIRWVFIVILTCSTIDQG